MGKLWMGMAAAFLVGTVGMAWADNLNPQPLPPGATQMRKAGGTQMTTHDQNQISGNLTGGAGAGKAKGLHKDYFIKFDQKTNTYSKWTKANGKTVPYTGGTKTGKGNAGFFDVRKSGGTNTKALSGNTALNGGTKEGMGDGSVHGAAGQ